MSEPELQLDPAIRIWVFLPIVLITFLIGIIRHYVSVLLSSPKKVAQQPEGDFPPPPPGGPRPGD